MIASLAACGDSGKGDQPDASADVDAAAIDAPSVDALITTPPCSTVTGTGSVTFTTDEGATFAASTPLTGTTYVFGLIGTTKPGELLVAVDKNILRSTDAGCTWTRVGAVDAPEAELLTLVGNKDGGAYGFGDNRHVVFTVGDSVTAHETSFSVVGLAPNGAAGHFRVVDSENGQIHQTEDDGATWARVGDAALPSGGIAYRAVFDPTDTDHVMIGTATMGARYTRDGGVTWNASTGLPKGGNVFSLAFSEASHDVVWAEGLDLADSSRHIYLSTDGGDSFTSVLDGGADVTLINGNRLAPHPTDPRILYFTFGTSYQNYGTDVYRFDSSDMSVSHVHHPAHRAEAVAFPPWNPSVMYLGLSHENVN